MSFMERTEKIQLSANDKILHSKKNVNEVSNFKMMK